MEQRFIICTDTAKGPGPGTSALDRNNITRHLEAKGWQVWHWFEDIWLAVAPPDSITPRDLRLELMTLLAAGKHVLVMLIEGEIKYSGNGPPAGWPWMAEKWGKPE
jgi:hypothetical protein